MEGAFTHQAEGKSPFTLKVGQAGTNPSKNVHYIKSASITKSAKTLGCLIAEKGQPITVPVQYRHGKRYRAARLPADSNQPSLGSPLACR